MKLKMNLRTKLIVLIISASAVIFTLYSIYVGVAIHKMASQQAEKYADELSQKYAYQMESILNYNMGYSKALANSLNDFTKFNGSEFSDIQKNFMTQAHKANKNWTSIWTTTELSVLNKSYDKNHGRLTLLSVNNGNSFTIDSIYKDMDSENVGSSYYNMKKNPMSFVVDPYLDNSFNVLMTSFSEPFYTDGKFAGLAGIDISLEGIQESVRNINPIEGSSVMVLSNSGTIVGHSNKSYIGKKATEIMPELCRSKKIIEKVASGQSFSYENKDNGKLFYTSFKSFKAAGTDKSWSFAITLPLSLILENAYSEINKSIIIAVISLLVLSIILALFARSITQPISGTTKVFDSLSKGEINSELKLNINSGDELQDMGNSVNNLIDGLQKTELFAREIEKGNLDAEYDLLGEKDSLGKALLEMRNSLKLATEQEKIRKAEEQKRNWATHGVALFADLLRNNYDSIEDMSYNIISNLVKYTNANQGGLFLLSDETSDERYLALMAAYAYNRRKYLEKRIELGEGLIGRCFLEAKTIFMTDLPKDYISITSGLGEDTPRCLIIVPMIVNEQVLGIIEMASFKKLEQHEIEFIEKVGENIASSISSLRINIQTASLLEQTKQQAEEMQAQEEEMRQNMEELQATQEESYRREEEIRLAYEKLEESKNADSDILNLVHCNLGVVEFNTFGSINMANNYFKNILNIKSEDELIGKQYTELPLSNKPEETEELWNTVMKGEEVERITKYNTSLSKTVFVKEKFSPIIDESGVVEKIVATSIDITEFYKN